MASPWEIPKTDWSYSTAGPTGNDLDRIEGNTDYLKDAVDKEVVDRAAAVTGETNARNAAIAAEVTARNAAITAEGNARYGADYTETTNRYAEDQKILNGTSPFTFPRLTPNPTGLPEANAQSEGRFCYMTSLQGGYSTGNLYVCMRYGPIATPTFEWKKVAYI